MLSHRRRVWARRLCLLLVCLATGMASAGAADAVAQAPAARQVADSAWFSQARLGVFIHWGLYSHAAGDWHGQHFYGITEWLMKRGRIPAAEYAGIAKEFNPSAFDAKAWVKAIKATGAKYIVITAKHHDGFAMFGSQTDRFNIVDATPFHRDPLRELADAARAEGVKLGFYYSQFQDWSDRDADGNDWDFAEKDKRFDAYLNRKALPQLRELLTRYGPISVIWFDTPGSITKPQSQQLYDLVKQLQPDCLISGRVGNGLGDFSTFGDAQIPASVQPGLPWEAIFTHNDSWGYSKYDQNFKPAKELVHILASVAAKGGNLLVNMGPDGLGRLPPETLKQFGKLGEWLRRNGESIYATQGTALSAMPWGVATRRGPQVYLHVLTRPADGRLIVPGFTQDPGPVRFLVGGAALPWKREGDSLVISLPAKLPDAMDSVIALDYRAALVAPAEAATLSRQYAALSLQPASAQLGGAAVHETLSYYHYFGDWKYIDTVDHLASPADSISWSIKVLEPGSYHIDLEYAADHASAGLEGQIDANGKLFPFQVLETGLAVTERPVPLVTHPIGSVHFDRPGTYRIEIRPMQNGVSLFKLRSLTLRPSD